MRQVSLASIAITLLAGASALAQQTTPAAPPSPGPAAPPKVQYGPPITLKQAKQAIAGAETEAERNDLGMAIAVIDSGGNLVAFERMDNTQLGSIRIAEAKARTALDFRRPSRVMQDALTRGGVGLWWLGVPGVLPLEGGLPIQSEGKVIGAIGVSGGLSTQDAQVAQAGANAVGK
ncbi:MAG: heme-binding protein [Acetobacteraceae bacterium]|nr:heme-binding protein [Acetobacteraceae bacterium]MBV8525355.1 heme-binding protein [Acetobacteraceae bacterium]MBV8588713.1 heme-binding protein [Acetobacteraceae bacterium]